MTPYQAEAVIQLLAHIDENLMIMGIAVIGTLVIQLVKLFKP